MFKHIVTIILLQLLCYQSHAQHYYDDSAAHKLTVQYQAAIDFTDAAINSISSLNSLIKKENYRNKVSSFNNPTSSEMGFNLQLEISNALKPLLEKAKHVNTNKFMDVVGSLVGNQSKTSGIKGLIPATGIFSTLTSMVGNLTVQEKKITKQDLDSFMLGISKYFGQYEKLNRINIQFDNSIDKIDIRLQELQTDLKDYILDLVTACNVNIQRSSLKQKSVEELLLKNLNEKDIEKQINFESTNIVTPETKTIVFPGDAIKAAKDITSTIQKIFAEYQKVYAANFNDIKNILTETKQLGSNINKHAIDNSISELQSLYTESKNADVINLRLTTLAERLKILVATEKLKP